LLLFYNSPNISFNKTTEKKDDFFGWLFVVFFAVALGYLLDSKKPIPSILKVISVIFVIFLLLQLLTTSKINLL